MNYYPFHIGDYISHTSHLSDLEDLAYRRMIDLYYQTEKPFLESDKSQIARKIKSTLQIVEILLPEFFEYSLDDGAWHSKRADEEIGKYHAIKEGGRKGAEKRWHKNSDSPPIATPLATNNQEPITNNHIIKTNPIAPKVAIPLGIPEVLWTDFLTLRKTKKLAVTQTALKGIVREADKANISLEQALTICCERGWGGFKSEWLDSKQTTKQPDSKMKDFWLQIEGGK